MAKAVTNISENRVKIHTSTGEKLAGLHSQIDFNMMCDLDTYILKKNTKILKARDIEIKKVLKARTNEGLTIKDTNIKINDVKLSNPQITKRSIIETALADYFDKYPV